MDILISLAPTVLTLLFAGVATVLGFKWVKVKRVVKLIIDAWEDDKISQKEFDAIMAAIKDGGQDV